MDTAPANDSPKLRLAPCRITDLSVAAYCIMRGVKLLHVEKGQLGQLSVFTFEPAGTAIVKEYEDGATAVCREYAAAMLVAKRALFSERNR